MTCNRFYSGNAVDVLSQLNPEIVDLTVTSPPYENLRNYNGFSFDAKLVLSAIYRVTKQGGVCVWIVGDKINGGRSLVSFEHPAIFPEKLARDHILSWSNQGDLVLDPMCGSGTTCKMAEINHRKWIGIDISKEYVSIAQKRLQLLKVTS